MILFTVTSHGQETRGVGGVRQDSVPFTVKLTTETNVFYEGQAPVFRVRATQDCYLLLLSTWPDGDCVVLYPNAYHTNSFIKANQEITIPPPERSKFSIFVRPPHGSGILDAIASLKPMEPYKNMEVAVRNTRNAYISLSQNQQRGVCRQLGVAPTEEFFKQYNLSKPEAPQSPVIKTETNEITRYSMQIETRPRKQKP